MANGIELLILLVEKIIRVGVGIDFVNSTIKKTVFQLLKKWVSQYFS